MTDIPLIRVRECHKGNRKVLLYVPHDKWVKRLLSYNALKIKYDKQNGNREIWEPVRRTRLLHLDDLEIINQFDYKRSEK